MHLRRLIPVLAASGLCGAGAAHAFDADDLTSLRLEDLMEIEVTSVSRQAEQVGAAPAAIFVLTREDIRRSGGRSIAELLRQVPGLHVARIGDINTHAVSSRGFADRLSDKLEVLIDGRTVYTPLFGGVFWDTVDAFLPDIERIEVIRGPGAALWGTNAITGVINIITRSSADSVGTHGYVQGGTEERNAAGVRTGGRWGESGTARLYAKAYEREGLRDEAGHETYNRARFRQAGFRADTGLGERQSLMLSGDAYSGEREDLFQSPAEAGHVDTSGGNFTARWNWRNGEDAELTAQAYYDRSKRFIPDVVFRETRDIGDLDVQQRMRLGASQVIVAGVGYRQSHDRTGGPPLAFIFLPGSATLEYYNAFVQDQIALTRDLELTLGSKFERNDYTGWESQPTARLGWQVDEAFYTWAAVSRAVRTPSRLDRDSAVHLAAFNLTIRTGNPDFDTEKLLNYQWGLRYAGDGISGDLALFHDRYDDLRSSEAGVYGNGVEGEGYGGELSLGWQPGKTLDFRLTYSALRMHLESKPGSSDTSTAEAAESASPQQQAGLRAAWQPAADWTAWAFLRHVGAASRSSPNGRVPAYTELNLRLAWQAARQLELALIGDNLLDDQHGELRSVIGPAYVEVPRSGLLELRWTW